MAVATRSPDSALTNNGSSIPPPPKRSVFSRVPPTLAVAIVAGVLAMVAFLVATSSRSGTQVAVAATDIPAGQGLTTSAVRYADVSASEPLLSTFVTADDLPSMKNDVATHTIHAGTAISRADFAPAAASAGRRSMSFPVDPEHAVGGTLRIGDVVDVIDGAPGGTGAQPAYVVTGAEILAVNRQSTGALNAGSKYSLTVALDAASGLRLSAAVAHGKVEVVRSTGAAPTSPSPAPNTGLPEGTASGDRPARP